MRIDQLGRKWALMLTIDVGTILANCIVVSATGTQFQTVPLIVLLVVFNHLATRSQVREKNTSAFQHYVGLLGLAGIGLASVSIGTELSLPLWLIPFALSIGVMTVLFLLSGLGDNAPPS